MADTGDDAKEPLSDFDKARGMTEDDKARLADTNMANTGGKEHRARMQELAKKQKEWKGAGEKIGLEIWRIEQFKVIPQEKETYGEFYNGDSYIVLNTYKPDPNKEKLAYNVHFWLGKDTSQDEAGSAAIKTVELDDLLGDLPVQYREVQGHERKLFSDLFPEFTVLEGGVASGFREVKPEEYKPRLLHISGNNKKMKVSEVHLGVESLNSVDAFVLDLGLTILQFRPPGSNAFEKMAANKFVNDLFSHRNGRPKKGVVDWDDDGDDVDLFWQTLSQDGKQPKELPKESKKKAEKKKWEAEFDKWENVMFHVSDENGDMEIKEVQRGVLDKAILKEEDDDVLIIDVGRVVFVWVGATANKKELGSAMKHAQDYLVKNNRPFWTPVERVMSGKEPKHFFSIFGCKHCPANI